MKLDFISFDIPEDKKIDVMSLLCSSEGHSRDKEENPRIPKE